MKNLMILSALMVGVTTLAQAQTSQAPAQPATAAPAPAPKPASGQKTRAEVQAEAIAAMKAGQIENGYATPGPLQGGRASTQ